MRQWKVLWQAEHRSKPITEGLGKGSSRRMKLGSDGQSVHSWGLPLLLFCCSICFRTDLSSQLIPRKRKLKMYHVIISIIPLFFLLNFKLWSYSYDRGWIFPPQPWSLMSVNFNSSISLQEYFYTNISQTWGNYSLCRFQLLSPPIFLPLLPSLYRIWERIYQTLGTFSPLKVSWSHK